jgi:DinB superfamily
MAGSNHSMPRRFPWEEAGLHDEASEAPLQLIAAMRSPTLSSYFEQIRAQRQELYGRIAPLAAATIWRRPGDGHWSVGQNLEHVNKLLRLFRWLWTIYFPLAVPIARLRRRRPFLIDKEDIYQHDTQRPPGVKPKDRSNSPIPYEELRRSMDIELARVMRLLKDLDEDVAGNIYYWDWVTGAVNVQQCVLLDYYHERRHFGFAHRLLDKWADKNR